MDTESAVRKWIEGYSRAWRSRDWEAVANLYTEDVIYRSHPLREPHTGRPGVLEYTRMAFESADSVKEVWFGEPVVQTDRAAVEYWAVVIENGQEQTLAGMDLLLFDPDGLCREHRDYWVSAPGDRVPPDGWRM